MRATQMYSTRFNDSAHQRQVHREGVRNAC